MFVEAIYRNVNLQKQSTAMAIFTGELMQQQFFQGGYHDDNSPRNLSQQWFTGAVFGKNGLAEQFITILDCRGNQSIIY